MSIPLHAVQHIRRMRGGSQPHLMRASDNVYYIVKHQNNPQSPRVLANEMFATKLGLCLGLPMPGVAVIEVSDWLVTHTEELRVETGGVAVPCSSGLQFASRYPCDPAVDLWEIFDYLPEDQLAKVRNLDQFARCLVLDKWLANSDGRQAVFARKRRSRYFRAIFIDQGYCFNAGQWSFPDSALRGVYARNCVYQPVTGWDAFEPALTRAEQMDVDEIWRVAATIPPEWYEFDSDGLNRLVETLYRRRAIIRDLITQFRNSSRNPFPSWTAS